MEARLDGGPRFREGLLDLRVRLPRGPGEQGLGVGLQIFERQAIPPPWRGRKAESTRENEGRGKITGRGMPKWAYEGPIWA